MTNARKMGVVRVTWPIFQCWCPQSYVRKNG